MDTQNPQKTQEPPPEAPADVHILHPITQAAVALHHTLPMLAKNVPLSSPIVRLKAACTVMNSPTPLSTREVKDSKNASNINAS